MRFRRKRRPRVVWLKPTGAIIHSSLQPTEQSGAVELNTTITVGNGAVPTIEIPLVIDQPPSETVAGAAFTVYQAQALNEQLEFGYKLRRIVGHIHLSCLNTTADPQGINFPGVWVTAGLIVRRVDSQTGQAIAPGVDVNPQLITNWSDPWIWRRSWTLRTDPRINGESGANFLGAFGWAAMPYTNSQFGDVRSGPHVDAKTARRLGPEERLFLDISFQGLPFQTAGGVQDTLTCKAIIDLRCLGTIMMNSGNRRNASR